MFSKTIELNMNIFLALFSSLFTAIIDAKNEDETSKLSTKKVANRGVSIEAESKTSRGREVLHKTHLQV